MLEPNSTGSTTPPPNHGEGDRTKTIMIPFLVIDCTSLYNCIIGRTVLAQLGLVEGLFGGFNYRFLLPDLVEVDNIVKVRKKTRRGVELCLFFLRFSY